MAEEYLVNNPGMTKYLNENYMLKSKVKEKLEELENLKLCSDKFYQLITEDKIKLLQKLLEEE